MADTLVEFGVRCLRAYFDTDPEARAEWDQLMAELRNAED